MRTAEHHPSAMCSTARAPHTVTIERISASDPRWKRLQKTAGQIRQTKNAPGTTRPETTWTAPRRPFSARASIPSQQNFGGSFMAPRPAPTRYAPKQVLRAQLTAEAAQQRAARARPASAREYNRWETTTNTFYVDFVKAGKVKNWPQFQTEGGQVNRLEEERTKLMEQLAKHPADLAQEFKSMTFQSDIFHKTPMPDGEPNMRLEPTLRASGRSPLQPGKPRWRK